MRTWSSLVSLLLICTAIHAQYLPERYPIIPKPIEIEYLSGEFELNSSVTLSGFYAEDLALVKRESAFFRNQVKTLYKLNLNYTREVLPNNGIVFYFDSIGFKPDGYSLSIRNGLIAVCGTRSGVFYGLETLLQLIHKDANGKMTIPCCTIHDSPRFQWRGMHLDVARHFFTKKEVKSYLAYMAMYKMNTFHWHLTDDQGWRIEIRSLPKLTSVGAWRNATLIGHFSEDPDRYDSTRYGGFYTQAEIREVVRFADSLHITVVPEIEMPGHVRALLAAYPENGSGAKEPVACTWGVFKEVLQPGETSLATMYSILDEVCQLFPGKYIHIGGDECPKEEWSKSDVCQELIRSNNLKDEHGLQSWFVQRIVTYLGTKGKKAIGWDEILEGGLADSAAVMSWRGEEGGIAAAKAHHYVVMTPGSHCYFDHYQSKNPTEPLAIGGYLPLDKVYSYDPVPASLQDDEKKYIMGVQANVWTEYIPTFSQVQYMIFPRMAALSEVAWSTSESKSYNDFLKRELQHFNLYSLMGVSYSRAVFDIEGSYSAAADGNGTMLELKSLSPYGTIRYSYGNIVTLGDSIYGGPIPIDHNMMIRASVFMGEENIGSDFVQTYRFHKAMGKKVTLRKQPAKAYNTGGELTLVDGITGRKPWTGSEWLGWWGDTLDAVIDLGKIDTIRSIHPIFLEDKGSWIHRPESITLEISLDGISYRKPTTEELHVISASAENIDKYESMKGVAARYVRVAATALPEIPNGHEGAGYPAWLFVSEIIVE